MLPFDSRSSVSMRVIHSPPNKQLVEGYQAVDFAANDQLVNHLPQSRNMAEIFNRKADEFEVDFDDTRQFAVWRWKDITNLVMEGLSPADRHTIQEPRDSKDISLDIRKRITDIKTPAAIRGLGGQLQPLPKTLDALIHSFNEAVDPQTVQFKELWGLIYLNIRLSYVSEVKLRRTITWLSRLRRVIELFNRCLDVSEEVNEARLAIVDVFDSEASRAWPSLDMNINGHLSELDASVKHLNDINSLSKVNLERQVKDMSIRHAAVPEPEEHATFPLTMLQFQQNEQFYGREEELKKLNDALDWRGNPALRTYTIYGRRGVGKTQIALEYAYSNPANFEAIFWIQCETSLSLRQSFTEMAVVLQLPGADRHGHHEENLIAVQKWLKLTPRRWLMIFDNAERESILKQYWPLGANGAILITSRKYYNFMKDGRRTGSTVKPFSEKQSWALLMQLLGGNWKKQDQDGSIKGSEEAAAKEFLVKLQGLALAIQQAANLINNPNIGGTTIASTFELFKENERSLPPRQSGDRSDIVHSLDTLWNMIFKHLSRNARDILSVVSFLSPDAMLIDLFLPRKQSALNGKLQFCKQNTRDSKAHTALSSIVNQTPALLNALAELVKSNLITQDGRNLSVHRVVQEAISFHDIDDLQASFDSAVQLVHEAFPKQIRGDPMFKDWAMCQAYIPHGAHLSRRFSAYTNPPIQSALKGSETFVDMLKNCAWYLYEIGDYDTGLRVIETAFSACQDKESLHYAHLCNTAASCYYELNRVLECRQNWEITRRIREELLDSNDIELSIIYHNLGNLETAAEQYDLAMAHFNHAKEIRLAIGEEDTPESESAASHLATTYLCIGRVYCLKQEWDDAVNYLNMSEALYLRTLGSGNLFMSHVHYVYGNIEYGKNRWRRAKQSYTEGLKISLAKSPVHPITAVTYYRLGCVEHKLRHHDVARGFLEKAIAIAELRSPSRDDGLIARILWKMAQVMDDDPDGSPQSRAEAAQKRNRAAVAKRSFMGRGEGDLVLVLDEDGNADVDEEEASYDALVPGYFR